MPWSYEPPKKMYRKFYKMAKRRHPIIPIKKICLALFLFFSFLLQIILRRRKGQKQTDGIILNLQNHQTAKCQLRAIITPARILFLRKRCDPSGSNRFPGNPGGCPNTR